MDTYQKLHSRYKALLNEAYKKSKSDKAESKRLYAQADELRQQLFSF